ncbi:glycosyltransferase [Cryobacterium algoricola]|uniref:Glycosyltransferase n=2 Tax=Cryobacterium algoricola TaxID=1259183 RepID=A0ABY2IKP8_9MICO|nr:glycosyltransferase [Cryobacterium algoricola]
MLYSVVVPVYKNAASIPDVLKALEWLQDNLSGDVEAVFVVDGSPDESAAILRRLLPDAPFSAQLLCHSRNFGSFAAIRTGFLAARGQFVAAMAADLQEPISLIQEFFAKLETGNWDVAVGTRVSRDDPTVSKVFSGAYWGLYRRFVQPDMPLGGVDVFACTRQVAEKFGHLGESHSSLIGLLFWLGYRRVDVPYGRVQREHGKSAWSFKKKFSYLLDSVFSFTSLPISIILTVGLVGMVVSLLAALVVLIAWLAGSITVPGYTALMFVLLLSTGSLLFALGIVGTYVWRAYENSKNRPSSVVMDQMDFGR